MQVKELKHLKLYKEGVEIKVCSSSIFKYYMVFSSVKQKYIKIEPSFKS